MKKKLIWTVSIAAVILLVAGATNFNSDEESAGVIKIGGLFALTGKWEVGGKTEANFAQIAIDEINAEGGGTR